MIVRVMVTYGSYRRVILGLGSGRKRKVAARVRLRVTELRLGLDVEA